MRTLSCIKSHYLALNLWQKLAWLLLGMLVVWTGCTFDQHGISNDEFVQHTYGQLLLKFYSSGFADQSAFHYKNLYLYGGMFDLFAAILEHFNFMWVWDMRHLLSAMFGLLGFVAVYRLACLIGGARLGAVAIWVLILTMPWTGAMFTHTKDVPFATCMVWALYFSVYVVRDFKQTQWRHLMGLGVAIGCALGIRIGGVFAVMYLSLLLAWASVRYADTLSEAKVSQGFIRLMQYVWVLWTAALLAFLLMAVFWPWGVSSPTHPLEAIESFSHFAFNMQTILDGKVYNIGEVPRTYLLQYLLVKLPELALLGLLSALLVAVSAKKWWQSWNETQRIAMVAVLVSVIFPLAFVLYDKPALYNGVRHFTFLLPSLAILAAWGLVAIYQLIDCVIRKKHVQFVQALWVGIALGLSAVTLSEAVALHPYEYMRVNHLGGDSQYAQYRWEGDYWSSAMRAVTHSLTNLDLPKRDKPYLVAACVDNTQIQPYLDARFELTRNWDDSDFYIAGTNMHCHEVMKGKIIGEVSREGMLLAVVKDRRALVGSERWGTPAKN